MKLLKTKLLFSLGSEEGEAEYKNYDWLYFRLSEFDEGSVREAATELVKAGAVDKIVRGNKALFRLTANGKEQLESQLRLNRGKQKVWDRIWRVVILTNPGSEARCLAKELGHLGYKRVSRAVYVTPFSVSEETRQLFWQTKWQNKGEVIESRRLIVGDSLQLAKNLWNLESKTREYHDFVNLCERLLKIARQNIMLLKQPKLGFKLVLDRYFGLIKADPGLPKKLLPADWEAEEAKELFSRLVSMTKTANF